MQILALHANAEKRGDDTLRESWLETFVEAQLELGEPGAAAGGALRPGEHGGRAG